MAAYAELAVTSNFSFLRGASHPRELVATADALGLDAIGIADRNSFAGVVRAYAEAKERAEKARASGARSVKLLVGTRLVTTDGFEVIAYPVDRSAYGRLCALLTAAKIEVKKDECELGFDAVLAVHEGLMLIVIPPEELPPEELPPEELPPGELPPGELPPGELPPGELPPGELPPGELPSGVDHDEGAQHHPQVVPAPLLLPACGCMHTSTVAAFPLPLAGYHVHTSAPEPTEVAVGHTLSVMPALGAGTHDYLWAAPRKSWVAGTSPAMTEKHANFPGSIIQGRSVNRVALAGESGRKDALRAPVCGSTPDAQRRALVSEGRVRVTERSEGGGAPHPPLAHARGTFSRKREKEAHSHAIFIERLARLAAAAPGRVFLAGVHRHRGDEPRRLRRLAELGERLGAPLVAVNDAHYHVPERRPLVDILTCIREKCTIAEAGYRLAVNAERHLKPAAEMARLFRGFEEALARTLTIASACSFSLEQLRNEYPDEPVPPGKTAQQHLEDLVRDGVAARYPKDKHPLGVPKEIETALANELALIAKLDFARYFLTVHDVVAFARSQDILCQGRGSAANSAVCYCLRITEVDPTTTKLLFARFISENRGEPPDIDVDFEHERREEVIQYIYERYGRHRAAICATVIHYRSRRAIREAGKALGLTPDVTGALAKTVWGISGDAIAAEHIRQAGLDPENRAIRQAVEVARELVGFPRHLSQHVGGFVLTRGVLSETVPIGHAAMDDRTFIEWDKDDIDVLGLMKVDVLALGMLSCLKRGLDLLKHQYGLPADALSWVHQHEPRDDPKVYEMLSQADSVGVFQVESRAQMSMLPRLQPRKFYDLVIEVAIVRPGPIQGDMVHPYLRRRDGLEPALYPSPDSRFDADELEEVLKRTLGVPLFQEQAMQIAITAAEFSPDDADGLRRAMATFRHNGTVHLYRDKFISGMTRRGYERAFAESCFRQIEGFGEYGFPESHAASFALLVYVSAWIKCHFPEVFCAAILNSQPMGFYQPAQLVRDARRHGVEVKEADVNYSEWDCKLEPPTGETPYRYAVRLGFRLIQGLRRQEIDELVRIRGNGYHGIDRLFATSGASRFTIERLAEADAFRSLGLDRRQALWAARRLDSIGIGSTGLRPAPDLLGQAPGSQADSHADPDNLADPRRSGLREPDTRRPSHRGARRPARKSASSAEQKLPLFAPHMGEELFEEEELALPAMRLDEHVVEDYMATGLSLKEHPVSFFRERLTRRGVLRNSAHRSEKLPQDMRIMVSGLVLMRQMPGTAKGVVFMTLEDETDIANIIVWRKVFEKHRLTVMNARLLVVRGRLQRAGLVVHVIADSFIDLTEDLRRLGEDESSTPFVADGRPREADLRLLKSRDFH